MRPRPSEIITGVRALLAETIAPELTSEHARSRLNEIRAVLAQISWDDAAFALQARCEQLARQLEGASPWTASALEQPPATPTFAGYQSYWEALAGTAVETLERLAAHLEDHPEDAAAMSAYRGIIAAV